VPRAINGCYMMPTPLDYHSNRDLTKPSRRFAFRIAGIRCGIFATLMMLHDNFILWYSGPTYPFFYPLTCLLVRHVIPPSFPAMMVLLFGPLAEWTCYGWYVDSVRKYIWRRKHR